MEGVPMPKYYVDSGKLSFLCEAEDHTEAVFKALTGSDEVFLGAIIRINEQGHDDDEHDSDVFLPTAPTIALLGEEYESFDVEDE